MKASRAANRVGGAGLRAARQGSTSSGPVLAVVALALLVSAACGGVPPEPVARASFPTSGDGPAREEEAYVEVAEPAPEPEPEADLGYPLTELAPAAPSVPLEEAITEPQALRRFRSQPQLVRYFEPVLAQRRRQIAAARERARRRAETRAEERGSQRRRRSGRVGRSAGALGGLGNVGVIGAGSSMGPGLPAGSAPPAAGGGVTNNQVAGVDEGGIVKRLGEHLVVLRRGRLFTVALGQRPEDVQPAARIDLRPPGERYQVWYDEMLVHAPSRTAIVIGYSYGVRATELALFRVAPDGSLSRGGVHHLRSGDYYSSRNYASRLVGDTLVMYAPHNLMARGRAALNPPMLRPEGRSRFRSILRSSEVLAPPSRAPLTTLHMVVTCDLGAPSFACGARGMLGGPGRTFFVSSDAVYVWVNGVLAQRADASLYRLPLDGTPPSTVKVQGTPIDQFSFDEREGWLRVLVRAQGRGDAMWAPEEEAAGALALLSLPLGAFSPGHQARSLAPAYRSLPRPLETRRRSIVNRFVGDYLLYGTGSGWRQAASGQSATLHLHHVTPGQSFGLALPHGIDRLEPMWPGAVAIGSDGSSLHFTSLALEATPRAADAHVQPGATQGELRSHGFFYRPTSARQGTLGLPVRSPRQPGAAHLVHGSAELLFLGVDRLRFSPLGGLAAAPTGQPDGCRVSCVDWYGNARPLFIDDRVFGLLGYELVEGDTRSGVFGEVGRTSFHPHPEPALAAR